MERSFLIAGAVVVLAAVCLVRAQQPAVTSTAKSTNTAMSSTTSSDASTGTARPSDAELRKRLTAEQYAVTCEAATEPAFRNAYWNNHEAGLYVDVISGKPLFSSLDKFDSGTGWPSFTKPIVKDNVVEHTDRSFGMDRTEVKAKDSDAHLGHLFDDGPAAAGGMRYCMNSASLRFIPVAKLQAEGFGEYLPLFEKAKGGPEKK